MKDLILRAATLKRELVILLCCIASAELVNLAAIIHYCRPAVELVSMAGFVIVIALSIYCILWIPRAIALIVKKLLITK